jgi:Leucine-rich repeat (LRR) protein
MMPDLDWNLLRELNLSKNSLLTISERIFSGLNNLKIIDISENPIAVFPAIWHCPILSQAILHHTQISDIPSNVSKLHCLECLDMSWCCLSEIVEHVADIPALKKILLSGNMFESPITLNLPLSCVHIDLFGACLSSLKFQSEAKRSRQDSAKQDMVRRFGKTLLQKTQQNTRVIQGHIYRDEHLSNIEISRANEVKVDSLRMKLGLARLSPSLNISSSSDSSSNPKAMASTNPKNIGIAGIRYCLQIFASFFLNLHLNCFLQNSRCDLVWNSYNQVH